ncbi:hypothetical protein V2G26_013908 [Clonostachys chloroleuca]
MWWSLYPNGRRWGRDERDLATPAGRACLLGGTNLIEKRRVKKIKEQSLPLICIRYRYQVSGVCVQLSKVACHYRELDSWSDPNRSSVPKRLATCPSEDMQHILARVFSRSPMV